jgi:hypothetical protein
MSRGLGWLESLVFDFLRHRGGSASFEAVRDHSLMYGDFDSYRGRVESVRRALRSLCRRGYVEKEIYKGVIIYTAALSKKNVSPG